MHVSVSSSQNDSYINCCTIRVANGLDYPYSTTITIARVAINFAGLFFAVALMLNTSCFCRMPWGASGCSLVVVGRYSQSDVRVINKINTPLDGVYKNAKNRF